MTDMLRIEDAFVHYRVDGHDVQALDGASLVVAAGETVGVVGESGSGKSTLGLLPGRLLPGNAALQSGVVTVDGQDLAALDEAGVRALRRDRLAFIPQDPIGALNPTLRIGRQLRVALRAAGRPAVDVVELLDRVKIAEPERVAHLYPHEISGGMAQRVVVAMAMARRPRLLIADEPTAALDTQVRNEVLQLIFGYAAEAGATIVWLSHDLNAVTKWCDRVAVMYGGRVVEAGPAGEVLGDPRHPYTAALASADPAKAGEGQRLHAIGGNPPILLASATGCAFAPRCAHADESCADVRPEQDARGGRLVTCHHPLAETSRVASREKVGC